MSEFEKNPFRQNVVDQYGPTAGLPLFEKVENNLSEKTQQRFDAAPKSIPIANDTKRLSRMKQQMNDVQLTNDQQIVFDAFAALGPSTNKEISQYLKNLYPEPNDKWEASTVNARNFELREYGKVTAAGKRQCTITKNIVTQWKIIDNGRSA